jgi:hypothetical protein
VSPCQPAAVAVVEKSAKCHRQPLLLFERGGFRENIMDVFFRTLIK